MKKIGIVILNYNNADLILNNSDTLKKYNSIYKIIIVDNNSSDDSFERLKELENEKIEVIKTTKNGGYAFGNNVGLRLLEKECDYAFIINPDVIINDDELKKIVFHMENNPEYAILGAQRVSKNNIFDQSQYWKLPNFVDEFLSYFYIFRKIFKKKEICKIKSSNAIYTVDVVPGCCFLLNMKIAKEIGYFDENTFLYYEENILSQKIKKINLKCGICVDVKYIHNHEKSASKNNSYKIIKKFLYDSKLYYALNYCNLNNFQKKIIKILNKLNRIERGIK